MPEELHGISVTVSAGSSEARFRVTPRMIDILQRASELALSSLGVAVVGTEHLLRVLLDDDRGQDPGGIATQLLARLTDRTELRRALDDLLSSEGYQRGSSEIL